MQSLLAKHLLSHSTVTVSARRINTPVRPLPRAPRFLRLSVEPRLRPASHHFHLSHTPLIESLWFCQAHDSTVLERSDSDSFFWNLKCPVGERTRSLPPERFFFGSSRRGSLFGLAFFHSSRLATLAFVTLAISDSPPCRFIHLNISALLIVARRLSIEGLLAHRLRLKLLPVVDSLICCDT